MSSHFEPQSQALLPLSFKNKTSSHSELTAGMESAIKNSFPASIMVIPKNGKSPASSNSPSCLPTSHRRKGTLIVCLMKFISNFLNEL